MKMIEYVLNRDWGSDLSATGPLVKMAGGLSSLVQIYCASSGKGGNLGDITMMGTTLGAKRGDTVCISVTGRKEEADARAVERYLRSNM